MGHFRGHRRKMAIDSFDSLAASLFASCAWGRGPNLSLGAFFRRRPTSDRWAPAFPSMRGTRRQELIVSIASRPFIAKSSRRSRQVGYALILSDPRVRGFARVTGRVVCQFWRAKTPRSAGLVAGGPRRGYIGCPWFSSATRPSGDRLGCLAGPSRRDQPYRLPCPIESRRIGRGRMVPPRARPKAVLAAALADQRRIRTTGKE